MWQLLWIILTWITRVIWGIVWLLKVSTKSSTQAFEETKKKLTNFDVEGGWSGCNHLHWSLSDSLSKQKLNFKRKPSWKLKRTKTLPKKIDSCWLLYILKISMHSIRSARWPHQTRQPGFCQVVSSRLIIRYCGLLRG